MATRLRQLKIGKVALVPFGANQEAHVLLYKAAEGAPVLQKDGIGGEDSAEEAPPLTLEERMRHNALWEQWHPLWQAFCGTVWDIMDGDEDDAQYADILMTSIQQFSDQAQGILEGLGLLSKAAPLLALCTEEVSKAGAVMAAGRKQRLQEAITALQAILDEAMPHAKTVKGVPMAERDKDEAPLAAMAKRAEAAEARVVELESIVAKHAQTPEEEEAAFMKSLPVATRARWEAERIEKDALKAAISVEKELRELGEYMQKTALYPLVGIVKTDWEMLRAIEQGRAFTPEQGARCLQLLKSANEVIRHGAAFKVVGKDGRGAAGEGAEAQAMALVAVEQDKDSTLGFADALAKVWKGHPALYQEYQNEKHRQGRVA